MLTMIGKKIAMDPLEEPDKIGEIYVPDQAKSRMNQGIVKYIGPDVTFVQVGDHVLFSGYTGTVIFVEGEGKLIVAEEDFIQAIIHDDKVPIYGLYHLGEDDSIFPAHYESAIQLIREAFQESEAYKKQRKFRLLKGVDKEREFKNA